MSYPVVWLPEAMSAFRRLRVADRDGAKQVAAAVAALAVDPDPDQSTALGGSGFHRLRLANYRVLYEVDADTTTIYIINVGSIPQYRARYLDRAASGRDHTRSRWALSPIGVAGQTISRPGSSIIEDSGRCCIERSPTIARCNSAYPGSRRGLPPLRLAAAFTELAASPRPHRATCR